MDEGANLFFQEGNNFPRAMLKEDFKNKYLRLFHTGWRLICLFFENVENGKTLAKNRFFFYFAKTYLWA